jgi:hypothetical protein
MHLSKQLIYSLGTEVEFIGFRYIVAPRVAFDWVRERSSAPLVSYTELAPSEHARFFAGPKIEKVLTHAT